MGQSSYCHLPCTLIRRTDLAVLVRIESEDNECELWILFSQCAPGEEEKVCKSLAASGRKPVPDVTLTISEWIAEQKGLDVSEIE